MIGKLRRLGAYIASRQGKHDIGVVIAAALALYEGLKGVGAI